ncbi:MULTISPECIES: hypothetical protein [unclassified Janthinobacterium]|uniref:hypothetical protein n=1 Tax=unclassified Janthinobacterium TaxID=2610881 RepID=UPI0003785A32|nr:MULTISPECIES: hypothetical protein [unclassified Janthinobacterium]MEC5161703.1 hypothetical protein [Janthinobacterium sp. CG_S6]
MSAPPLKGHKACCAGKHRHPDELTARAAAQRVLSRGNLGALYVYICPVCGGWHLTRSSQGIAVTRYDPLAVREIQVRVAS